MHYKVPMALVSTCPKKYIEIAIGTIGFEWIFSVIVATEDVHRGKPDLEIFVYTSQLSGSISLIIFRILDGNGNLLIGIEW
ncbi:hypothetical protein CQW23_06943 [Capsicum baccatum]|uniref:Uncharacterized protein n=1 Tax=Capsicum baccatum TaxID=33114 RepID=A0A2G2X4T8_CAPBA|nr:hypothetical protein CQW23_06943 [Capsicum baccatum]